MLIVMVFIGSSILLEQNQLLWILLTERLAFYKFLLFGIYVA